MQIFGPLWDAPVCEDEDVPHVPTPVGHPCLDCGVPIKDGDQGYLIPFIRSAEEVTVEPHHRLCLHRQMIPTTIMIIPGYNT